MIFDEGHISPDFQVHMQRRKADCIESGVMGYS